MPTRAVALTASERRFARWLRKRLGFVGAETFIARRGLPMIRAALDDGVLEWRELPGQRGRWKVNPAVKKPAAFLRWLVDQLVVEGR